jgi:hypothetical protein
MHSGYGFTNPAGQGVRMTAIHQRDNYVEALERAVRELGFDPQRLVQGIESGDSHCRLARQLALSSACFRIDPWVAKQMHPQASREEITAAERWLMSVRLTDCTAYAYRPGLGDRRRVSA